MGSRVRRKKQTSHRRGQPHHLLHDRIEPRGPKGVGGGPSLPFLRRPRQDVEFFLQPGQLGWVLQQGQQQAAQGGGGGFVAGKQQQQKLLRHVVVAQGQTGFIQAAGQQIKAAGGEGCSRCHGGLRLLEHSAQAPEQTLAGLAGTGVGAAGQGEWQGEETLAPGFEIHEQGIAIHGVKAQHRAGNHAEGKTPQFGHQGHRRI